MERKNVKENIISQILLEIFHMFDVFERVS